MGSSGQEGTAIWEPAGASTWNSFPNLGPALRQQPAGGLPPMVRSEQLRGGPRATMRQDGRPDPDQRCDPQAEARPRAPPVAWDRGRDRSGCHRRSRAGAQRRCPTPPGERPSAHTPTAQLQIRAALLDSITLGTPGLRRGARCSPESRGGCLQGGSLHKAHRTTTICPVGGLVCVHWRWLGWAYCSKCFIHGRCAPSRCRSGPRSSLRHCRHTRGNANGRRSSAARPRFRRDCS